VYSLAVARDYVRSVGEHLIVPAPAGDDVFPRRTVVGEEDVVTGSAGEHFYRTPVVLAVKEKVVAISAREGVRSRGAVHYVLARATAQYVAGPRPFLPRRTAMAHCGAAADAVVAGSTLHGVRTRTALQAVVGAKSEQRVWPTLADEVVVACRFPLARRGQRCLTC
jgi:hypothetical protein